MLHLIRVSLFTNVAVIFKAWLSGRGFEMFHMKALNFVEEREEACCSIKICYRETLLTNFPKSLLLCGKEQVCQQSRWHQSSKWISSISIVS